MRTLALAVVLVASAVGFIAMSPPPVEQLVEGQAKCGNDICMGSAASKVHMKGPVSFETSGSPVAYTANPDGGLGSIATKDSYVVSSTKALINYDFPSLSFLVATNQCADSWGVTIANCPLGSGLLIGVDQPLVNSNGTVQPFLSAANTVFARACSVATDGGTFNMPDASYIVRCIP